MKWSGPCRTFAATIPMLLLSIAVQSEAVALTPGATVVFRGMCDASGAVPLSSSLFMVADDEDNILRVYNADEGGPPVNTFNLTAKLQHKLQQAQQKTQALDLDDELDLEAATEVDGVSYWLTSHGRNKKGKQKAERFQLIALAHDARRGTLEVVGQPFGDLLQAMMHHASFAPYRLGEASTRAAESEYAVNIEGMTARFGGGVYIGFRNPVPKGKALIVAMANPEAVARGAAPKFEKPLQLDLGGLGVRGLSSWQGSYIIAAGDTDAGKASALFRWQGPGTEPQKLSVELPENFNPEAFFTPELRHRFLVLSDDGSLESVGEKACKKRKEASQKSFRGIWLHRAQDVQVRQEHAG